MVCATSEGSDQPAHMCSLIRAYTSRLNKLLTGHHSEFLSLKGGGKARLSLHLSNCHIVGKSQLNYSLKLNIIFFNSLLGNFSFFLSSADFFYTF